MQNFLTVLIEVFSITAFLFFAIAFVVGFIEHERELHPANAIPDIDIDIEQVMEDYESYHKPQLTDVVVPFTRPYRTPACEPINWQLWGIRDLRRASQRAAFGVPVEVDGKSLTKPQFVALYEAALEVAIADAA